MGRYGSKKKELCVGDGGEEELERHLYPSEKLIPKGIADIEVALTKWWGREKWGPEE